MGRSVSYPSNSIVAFTEFYSEDEDYTHEDWQLFKDQLLERALILFPSMWVDRLFIGQEDLGLAANNFARFGVSEYYGCVAVWLTFRDDCNKPELALQWFRQVQDKFLKEFSTMTRIGVMSNGEAVYKRIA